MLYPINLVTAVQYIADPCIQAIMAKLVDEGCQGRLQVHATEARRNRNAENGMPIVVMFILKDQRQRSTDSEDNASSGSSCAPSQSPRVLQKLLLASLITPLSVGTLFSPFCFIFSFFVD